MTQVGSSSSNGCYLVREKTQDQLEDPFSPENHTYIFKWCAAVNLTGCVINITLLNECFLSNTNGLVLRYKKKQHFAL